MYETQTPSVDHHGGNKERIADVMRDSLKLLNKTEKRVIAMMLRKTYPRWVIESEIGRTPDGSGYADENNRIEIEDLQRVKETVLTYFRNTKGLRGLGALSSMMSQSMHRPSAGGITNNEVFHTLGTVITGNCLDKFLYERTNCIEQMAACSLLIRFFSDELSLRNAVIIPYNLGSTATSHATPITHDHFALRVEDFEGKSYYVVYGGITVPIEDVFVNGSLDKDKIRKCVEEEYEFEKEKVDLSHINSKGKEKEPPFLRDIMATLITVDRSYKLKARK